MDLNIEGSLEMINPVLGWMNSLAGWLGNFLTFKNILIFGGIGLMFYMWSKFDREIRSQNHLIRR